VFGIQHSIALAFVLLTGAVVRQFGSLHEQYIPALDFESLKERKGPLPTVISVLPRLLERLGLGQRYSTSCKRFQSEAAVVVRLYVDVSKLQAVLQSGWLWTGDKW
jgi:hypothetical protein